MAGFAIGGIPRSTVVPLICVVTAFNDITVAAIRIFVGPHPRPTKVGCDNAAEVAVKFKPAGGVSVGDAMVNAAVVGVIDNVATGFAGRAEFAQLVNWTWVLPENPMVPAWIMASPPAATKKVVPTVDVWLFFLSQ